MRPENLSKTNRSARFAACLVLPRCSERAPAPTAARAADLSQVTTLPIHHLSGFGCWSHTYSGAITLTNRTVIGCGNDPPVPVANYTGGGGSLNDGVIASSRGGQSTLHADIVRWGAAPESHDHAAPRRDAGHPSIASRFLAAPTNAIPAGIHGVTVEIGGVAIAFATTPFGVLNALGVPVNDEIDLSGSALAGVLTDLIRRCAISPARSPLPRQFPLPRSPSHRCRSRRRLRCSPSASRHSQRHVAARQEQPETRELKCSMVPATAARSKWRFEGMPDPRRRVTARYVAATACFGPMTSKRRHQSLWSDPVYVRGESIGFHFCPACGCVAYWRALEPKRGAPPDRGQPAPDRTRAGGPDSHRPFRRARQLRRPATRRPMCSGLLVLGIRSHGRES